MNNDLEQFSEEYLKEIINSPADDLTIALARIALAAKQAKPVGYLFVSPDGGVAYSISNVEFEGVKLVGPIYSTPQPAHTDMSGFDSALAGSEVTVITNYFTPDGWKLVPIEPTEDMLNAGCRFASEHNTKGSWSQMLAAAPKPESE